MRNAWLVAKHEYRRLALRRGFLILTLLPPVAMVALVAVIIFVEESRQNKDPIGYVDPAGMLDESLQAELPNAEDRVQVREFADEASGLAALEAEEVQALFVMPADFPASLETTIYYRKSLPEGSAWSQFDGFIRHNLLQDYPEALQARLKEGPSVSVEDIDSGRTFSESSVINIVLPFVAAFLFFMVTMGLSSQMLQVVADEKESRTMEILLTSISPGEMLGGKMAALMGMALTQLFIYLVTLTIVLAVLIPRVPALQGIELSGEYLAIVVLFFLPTLLLIEAVMVAAGSAAPNLEQGQQFAGLLNFAFIAPVMLAPLMMINPASLVFKIFTYFPTTSFLTISMRWGFGSVPLWQVAISWVILIGTTIFALWAAIRIFHTGMLRYGQTLTWKGMVAAVRGS